MRQLGDRALTTFNAALGLNREGKAEASVEALQKMSGTEIRFFQSFLETTSLSLRQWAMRLAVAHSMVVVVEAWKFVLRRHPERPAVAVPAAERTVPQRPTRPVATSG